MTELVIRKKKKSTEFPPWWGLGNIHPVPPKVAMTNQSSVPQGEQMSLLMLLAELGGVGGGGRVSGVGIWATFKQSHRTMTSWLCKWCSLPSSFLTHGFSFLESCFCTGHSLPLSVPMLSAVRGVPWEEMQGREQIDAHLHHGS